MIDPPTEEAHPTALVIDAKPFLRAGVASVRESRAALLRFEPSLSVIDLLRAGRIAGEHVTEVAHSSDSPLRLALVRAAGSVPHPDPIGHG